MLWLVLLLFLTEPSCLRPDNCPPNKKEKTPNQCTLAFYRKTSFSYFKIGNKALSTQLVLLELKSRIPNAECALGVNIGDVFKKLTPPRHFALYDITIRCLDRARVSFCRPENFTANDVTLYVRLEGQCHTTGTELAVWGRVSHLYLLSLDNGVAMLQDENATKADLEGLSNIGVLLMRNLSKHEIPRIFLANVWDEIGEMQLADMSLTRLPNILQETMPNLQSLMFFRINLTELPAFPWCTRRLKLPRNFSRTRMMNEIYSGGAALKPHVHRRFFAVNFHPAWKSSFKISLAGNLDRLSLRGNNLARLNSTIFEKVTNLKVIDLIMNKLWAIPERTFERQQDIVELHLAHNSLTSLNGTAFGHLRNLRILNMGNNFISTLQNSLVGDNLRNLEVVIFENNSLRAIEQRAFSPAVLTTLKKVFLCINKLREIPAFAFYARKLEMFDMSANKIDFASFVGSIEALDVHSFVYTQKGTFKKTLNLKSNRIEKFDVAKFSKPGMFKFFNVLRAFKIILTDNPLRCDCKTRLLQTKLSNWTGMAREITVQDFDTWVCNSPSDLRGKKILSVSPKALRCETPYPKCPSFCTCYRSYFEALISVDCRRRNLTAAPDELPNGRIVLHLENNKIESLSFSRSMENVSALYVSHNKLRRVNLKHFPSKLKEIYLNSNKLTTLPESFQNLSLSRINLQNNFFTCGCENSWMKKWLKREAKAFIGGAGSVACSSGDNQVKPLVSVEDTDFICTQSRDKVNVGEVTGVNAISAYVVAGFLFIVLVTVAIVYGFRKELKLVLYTRFNWHPFDRVDDSDPSKIYDAFVSFNKGDVGWVMETLRNKLENDNPPYKLCIHCRDFIPGARIAENILDSVKTSRRMIMVLSRHFIQSEWCMLEFRAAHRKVLKGRANYLIIVVFDDVDLESLDEELKLYLKTNTYLSVHSKWFWQQLKYALPQKRLETRDALLTNEGLEFLELRDENLS